MSLRMAIEVFKEGLTKRTSLPEEVRQDLVAQLDLILLASKDDSPQIPVIRSQPKQEVVKVDDELAEEILGERSGIEMAELVDPELDHCTMSPIDPKMPVGAKTLIGNRVYVLQANRSLLYSKEETEKFQESRKK